MNSETNEGLFLRDSLWDSNDQLNSSDVKVESPSIISCYSNNEQACSADNEYEEQSYDTGGDYIMGEDVINQSKMRPNSSIKDDESSSIKCEFCEKSFTQRRYLKQHLLIHSDKRQHECAICHKTFKQKSVLNRHKLSHISEKKFQCEICTKHFTLKAHLQRHLLIHFGEKTFRCNLCGRMFSQKQHLTEHMLTHSQVKRYVCEVCDEIFIRKRAYHDHIVTHGTDKNYLCNVCSKSFCQKTALDDHIMTIHNQEKNFICDICNKGFAEKANLSRHQLVHLRKNSRVRTIAQSSSGSIKAGDTLPVHSSADTDYLSNRQFRDSEEKLHNAPVHNNYSASNSELGCSAAVQHRFNQCNAQFDPNFQNNQSIDFPHLNAEKFNLPNASSILSSKLSPDTTQCTAVNSSSNLSLNTNPNELAEISSLLTGESLSNPKENQHQCPVCKKYYQNQEKLRRHSKIHIERPRFSCDVCNQTFSQKRYIKQHKLIHSEVKSFNCDVCWKSFSRNSYLNQHKLNHQRSGERRFKCEICDKGFSQRSDVKRHKLTHLSERNFHCDLCDKSFIQRAHLLAHNLTHSEERKFVCEVCNRGFLKKANLMEHKFIHQSEKNYVCDICGRAFSQKTNLSRHKLIHLRDKDGVSSYYSVTSQKQEELCRNVNEDMTYRAADDTMVVVEDWESTSQLFTSEFKSNSSLCDDYADKFGE